MINNRENIYIENKKINEYFISRIKIISIYVSIEQITADLDDLLKKIIDLYLSNKRMDENYKFSSYYSPFLLDYLNNLTERGLIEKNTEIE